MKRKEYIFRIRYNARRRASRDHLRSMWDALAERIDADVERQRAELEAKLSHMGIKSILRSAPS